MLSITKINDELYNIYEDKYRSCSTFQRIISAFYLEYKNCLVIDWEFNQCKIGAECSLPPIEATFYPLPFKEFMEVIEYYDDEDGKYVRDLRLLLWVES